MEVEDAQLAHVRVREKTGAVPRYADMRPNGFPVRLDTAEWEPLVLRVADA
jgi:hypothetical protein